MKYLILIGLLAFSLACGGGGGGSSSSDSNSEILQTQSEIFPKPAVSTKQVFSYQSQLYSNSRYSIEITEVSTGRYTEIHYFDGMPIRQETTNYSVSGGNAFISSFQRNNSLYVYTPAIRDWVIDEELPFSQQYWTTVYNTSTGDVEDIFFTTEERTYEGDVNYQINGSQVTGFEAAHQKVYLDTSGNLLDVDLSTQLKVNGYGTLRAIYQTEEQEETYRVELEEHLTQDQSNYQWNGDVLSKPNQSLQIDFSGLGSISDHYKREVYELGLSVDALSSLSLILPDLAQGVYIYEQYYLYESQLPNTINQGTTLENYVTQLQANDPFTFYFSPESSSAINSLIGGDVALIGVGLELSDGSSTSSNLLITDSRQVVIKDVEPFTRAYFDGLQTDDIILEVDDQNLNGMLFLNVVDLIKRSEGETIDLLIERNGVELNIQSAAENHMAWLEDDSTLYVNWRVFSTTSNDQVIQDIEALDLNGVDAVIIDLRDNSGGSKTANIELLDYFIDLDDETPKQVIMSTLPNNVEYYFGEQESENFELISSSNIVILIDEKSASASEIFAGVMQYYSKATVMGQQSFGKGVGQTIFNLVDGSGIWVTSVENKLAGEVQFHEVGIQPDYEITDSTVSLGNDLVLESAKAFLKGEDFSSAVAKPNFYKVSKLRTEDPFLKLINRL